MQERRFKAVVLAAGMGTRMRSELPKVMHRVLDLPMVAWPTDIALRSGAEEVAVVVGHCRELVESFLAERYADRPVTPWVQEEMRGTADAVRSARGAYDDFEGSVLILYGDVPNLPRKAVEDLWSLHAEGESPVSLITAEANGPTEYGRIVRDADGAVEKIVEHKDATEAQRAIREVNVGIYLVDAGFLRDAITDVTTDNAQGELYLTDMVELARERSAPAQALVAEEIRALEGVNNRAQLAAANAFARDVRNEEIMLSGVTMWDPTTTWVCPDAEVGQDAELEPNVQLLGRTVVGHGAVIESGCRLVDVSVDAQVRVPAGTYQRGGAVRPVER